MPWAVETEARGSMDVDVCGAALGLAGECCVVNGLLAPGLAVGLILGGNYYVAS
jgi:hypothetical protein